MSNQIFNITDLFFEAAKHYPNNISISCGRKQISYRDLEHEVIATSLYLLNKGVRKGDRVLLFVPVSIDLYRIVLALFRIGATAVFLDEWVSFKRLEACCEVADCKVFIGTAKSRLLGLFSRGVRQIPIKLGITYDKGSPDVNVTPTTANDTALITFTTGSTGTPKAAIRSHAFLKEQFLVLKEKINPLSSDVDMPVFPIVLLLNLGAGAHSVIADFNSRKPETLDPEKIIRQLKKFEVNRIEASPYFIKKLASYLLAKKTSLPQVKFVFTGGAPVFPSEAELFCRVFPDTRIEVVYGSTEAEPISAISASELSKEEAVLLFKGLKVGQPHPKSQVKIIDLKDGNIVCQDENDLHKLEKQEGTIGEIIVSGPHVLSSYFNNAEAFKRNKIRVNETVWHRTGDSGYFEKGILYLTGRCNTLIRQNEKLISTFMIENFLQSLPEIAIGTIIEVDQKIIAAIEPGADKKPEDLVAILKRFNLEISKVIFFRKIPRDQRHHSKIDYLKLKALVMDKIKT